MPKGGVRITYRGQTLLKEIFEGKKTVRRVSQELAVPPPQVLDVIGEELERAFRGDNRLMLGSVRFSKTGRISFSRSGSYSRGIKKRVSPDGSPYPKVEGGQFHKTITLKMKQEVGSPHAADHYVLRDSDALMNDFTHRVTSHGVQVGYLGRPDLNAKSLRLENGGRMQGDVTSKGKDGSRTKRTFDLTPRPHRDAQPEVLMVVRGIIKRWAERNKGKKL